MYFRPPPRPSPASVAYSDDEDAMSMAKPPIPDDSSSSVTDKPSDLGDSTEVSVDGEQSSILLFGRLWSVRMQKGEDHFPWAYEPGYTSVLDDLRDVGDCTELKANTAFVSTQSFLGGVLLYCPQSCVLSWQTYMTSLMWGNAQRQIQLFWALSLFWECTSVHSVISGSVHLYCPQAYVFP